jgi:hypothetical protein
MRTLHLERRIAALERALRGGCNCRWQQATGYHNLAELVAIMSIHCPVHGRRDLGYVVWVPASTPLHPEDRRLCSCPPCVARDWRERRRGPLTEAERQQAYASWEEQVSGEVAGRICRDQTRIRQLLQYYLRRKNQHDTMRGNKQRRKTL